MAQIDPIQKGYHHHQSPRSARNQNIKTIEQILQGKDDSSTIRRPNNSSSPNSNSPNWMLNSFPSPAKSLDHPEECSTPKKSVLAKVKEKAKKWKHTLSFKKKNDNGEDHNTTPSWGVNLEEDYDYHVDDQEIDDDPEYLGAPMYESEMAPDNYKVKAREYPRPNPVVPEEHAAPSLEKHSPASKTITEAMSERLAPAYAAFSGATTTIATKVASFTAGKRTESSISLAESEALYSAVGSDFENSDSESEPKVTATATSPQKSDKGISVKEYFVNKLEPGEDERALSQVISEAITPRKSADGDDDISMAGKVRSAVTSLLQAQESSESPTKETKTTFLNTSPLTTPKLLRQKSVHCPPGTTFSSKNPMTNRVSFYPPFPISTNPEEVDDEDDDDNGRKLQAN